MSGMALPGLGPLQETLRETNELLGAVLEELRQTNRGHLADMSSTLKELHEKVERALAGD